jgi:hypothetical protein
MILRLALFLSVFMLAGSSDSAVEYRGHYTNVDYGFAVTIPSGTVAHGAAESAPNHGFVIAVQDGSTISVDATYDTIAGETGESFDEQMTHKNGPPKASLGGLKAWESKQQSSSKDGDEYKRGIVARRVSKDGDAIIYSISETAKGEHHGTADHIFDRLVGSFRVVPITVNSVSRPK